ncbi:fructose-bisphosphate aldolase [Colletotrichum orchidophilum]|uniref:fructose-bisphosphate aldolase n=1 Tax=Colletotrichum orchidophilum TaxID=1209926 RepID=A0A1G4AWQ2_9PEZI|nr:fructose-bisphosphate aldolase [Colletotrichum orchidophilum]OHE93482.1 fructose-bisphosphate aldolase [Colletotrichum orchidophilum]
MGLLSELNIKPGVVYGDDLLKLFSYAKAKQFAIPAANVTSSSTAVAALEAAREAKSPIILQTSQGGAAYFAGKGIPNSADKQEASVAGAIAAAHYITSIAPIYGVPVVLHSDHCAKKLLPWLDGMISADEEEFKRSGHPLFSSHMIDLSEEDVAYNIETTAKYLKRSAPMKLWLEMEIGITGGEEDGVNNEDVDNNSLYTQPEDIYAIYQTLSPISPFFSIAAGFGNVHGVYKPGNVKLHPELLGKHQEFVQQKLGTDDKKPVFFVFHGGSGSAVEEFQKAISFGVVKVNVDTDLQWAYLTGIRDYVTKNIDYLKTQVGNPEGDDKPNKKKYDPRVWVREGEKTMKERVKQALFDFNANDGFLRRNYLFLNPPVAPKQDGAIRFGILGAVNIAPMALIVPAKSHSEVIVQSIAARDRTKAAAYAAKHGIPDVKDSYQAVIDDPSLDAIYVPLPNGLHYEWALKALQAGKHVLLEKPSVSNTHEAEALLRLPLLAEPGAPGNVEHVKASAFLPWFAIGDDDIRFQYDLAGGGLMDLGTYTVSSIRQTFGVEPEECVTAQFKTMPSPEERVDYAWDITWRMANEGTAHAEGAFRTGTFAMGLPRLSVTHKEVKVPDEKLPTGQEKTRKRKIAFANFMLGGIWHRIDVVDEFVVKRTGSGDVVRKWTEKTSKKAYTFKGAGLAGNGEEYWLTYRHQLEQFVNRVKGRETSVWVDGEDSISQMRMIDMAYEKAGLPLRKSTGVTI